LGAVCILSGTASLVYVVSVNNNQLIGAITMNKSDKRNIEKAARAILNNLRPHYVKAQELNDSWYRREYIQACRDSLACLKYYGLIKDYNLHDNTITL